MNVHTRKIFHVEIILRKYRDLTRSNNWDVWKPEWEELPGRSCMFRICEYLCLDWGEVWGESHHLWLMRIMKFKVRYLLRDVSHPASTNEQFRIIYLRLTSICFPVATHTHRKQSTEKSGNRKTENFFFFNKMVGGLAPDIQHYIEHLMIFFLCIFLCGVGCTIVV